jgi:hypothetical protein
MHLSRCDAGPWNSFDRSVADKRDSSDCGGRWPPILRITEFSGGRRWLVALDGIEPIRARFGKKACRSLDGRLPRQIDISFEIIGNLDTTPIKMASMPNPRGLCHVTRCPRGDSAIARVTANNPVRR